MKTVRNSRNGDVHGKRVRGATEGNKETLIEIVEKARDGDQDAFGRLTEQFQSSVERWVKRFIRNDADAADLCQEIWLLVWQKIGTLQDPACFPGWLRRVACNLSCQTAARYERKRKKVQSEADVSGGNWQKDDGNFLDQLCARDDSPLDELVRVEQAEQVWKCLRLLKPGDQETLTYFLGGDSLKEAAAISWMRRSVPSSGKDMSPESVS